VSSSSDVGRRSALRGASRAQCDAESRADASCRRVQGLHGSGGARGSPTAARTGISTGKSGVRSPTVQLNEHQDLLYDKYGQHRGSAPAEEQDRVAEKLLSVRRRLRRSTRLNDGVPSDTMTHTAAHHAELSTVLGSCCRCRCAPPQATERLFDPKTSIRASTVLRRAHHQEEGSEESDQRRPTSD